MVVGGGTPVGTPTIETGSYVGTGTYGASNPNSLTFRGVPVFVLVYTYAGTVNTSNFCFMCTDMLSGFTHYGTQTPYGLGVSLSGKTVSWYGYGATQQHNVNGVTYHYFALTV